MAYGIAQTIREQIENTDKFALWAWGAKDFVYADNGLKFKTSGGVKFKGHVFIRLTGNDTYEVTTYRIRGVKVTYVHEFRDIYVENLVSVIKNIVE